MKSEELSTILWNEIKNKKINMFSIPNQTVEKYCEPISIDPNKLYLTIKVSSVLPALEEALGSDYVVEQINKYLVVSRV